MAATGIDASDLIEWFNLCFLASRNTRLQGNAPEPEYLPATALQPAIILFRHDYVASALHEVSHWCIAGEQRRTQVDYGYWYAPDGRNSDQQLEFYKVEVKPQALEYLFSRALGLPFRVSADNLEGEIAGLAEFERQVYRQADDYMQAGLPTDAALWLSQLEAKVKA